MNAPTRDMSICWVVARRHLSSGSIPIPLGHVTPDNSPPLHYPPLLPHHHGTVPPCALHPTSVPLTFSSGITYLPYGPGKSGWWVSAWFTARLQKSISTKQSEIFQKVSKTPLLYPDVSISKSGWTQKCSPAKAHSGCDFSPLLSKHKFFFWASVSLFARLGNLELWLTVSPLLQLLRPCHRNPELGCSSHTAIEFELELGLLTTGPE